MSKISIFNTAQQIRRDRSEWGPNYYSGETLKQEVHSPPDDIYL